MIVAGFGMRNGACLASLHAAFIHASAGQPPVDLLAVPLDRQAKLVPLAEALGLPMIGIAPAALAAVETETYSNASLQARGVGSVSEAAALAAAGPGSRLLRPRFIAPDRMATCALAMGYPA